MSNRLFVAILPLGVLLHLWSCGASTTPSQSSAQPTPTPLPVPTPTPAPTPTPITAICVPTPPPIHGMKLKVQVDNGYRKLLDSRPIVDNVNGYCAATGSSAGAPYCDTRPEGDLQREACDALAVGHADDTGRWGPTWWWNNKACSPVGAGEGQTAGCVNSPDNQFMVIAKGPGTYMACPEVGPCGSYEIQ